MSFFLLRSPDAIRKYRLTEDDETLNGGTKEAGAAAKVEAKEIYWMQGGTALK